MTSGINPINVNPQGVGANSGYGAQPQQKSNTSEQPAPTSSIEQTPVDPNSVLNFMSASAACSAPAVKNLDPSKYVDKESEARIATFMGSFEDQVAQGLLAFNEEFPGTAISDATKMAVVLKQVESQVN